MSEMRASNEARPRTPTRAELALVETDLARMFREMVRTRALDERAMRLQRQGRIGFYVPSFGEEAAQIGSAFALGTGDWIAPSYRQPGVALLRGVSPVRLFDNCFGNCDDAALGRQMPVHYSLAPEHMISISSPIGTQIVHAAGVGMAMRIRNERAVCATYFGDGATSSNDFHTGMNFAGVWKAPVVFLCVNNQWAISLCVSGQTAATTMAQKAEAYGMPGVRVDGNDVLAVYAATRRAVAAARAGQGPTLLELLTFRMGPHSSSDDPSRYRPREEEEAWRGRDPIRRFAAWLESEGILTREAIEGIHAEAETEMAEAAKVSEQKSAPPIESLFEDVYATVPPHLARQRALLLAEGGGHAADADAAFPL
jgi:pyruvate dehydrogenase E1 component alpha subunit